VNFRLSMTSAIGSLIVLATPRRYPKRIGLVFAGGQRDVPA